MEEADLYPIAQENAADIVAEIQSTYNVDKTDVNWTYFVGLLKNKYNVSFDRKQFTNTTLAKRFAGAMIIGNKGSIISYNDGIYQNRARQHFTIVHEGVHYMVHKDDHKDGEHYSVILDNGVYSPEEMQDELLTNQTASLVMLNDEALTECMHTGKTCYTIANLYGMSGKAIFYRMVNYLRFNLGVASEAASYLAGRYCYGSTPAACTFLCFFINNFESIMDWVNNGYHAFIHWLSLCREMGYSNVPSSYWYQVNHLLPDSVLI